MPRCWLLVTTAAALWIWPRRWRRWPAGDSRCREAPAASGVAAALLPKLVIDELTGAQRVERLILYVGAFAGYLFLANALSNFFFWDGFTHRVNVSAEFDLWIHERLTLADFGCMESPEFHDMQAKAKKFLTCDYHGFGYLLDCAMRIVGQMFTLIGLIAILLTLNVWFVALFVVLSVICSSNFSIGGSRKPSSIEVFTDFTTAPQLIAKAI